MLVLILRKWLTNEKMLPERWKDEEFKIYPFDQNHRINYRFPEE